VTPFAILIKDPNIKIAATKMKTKNILPNGVATAIMLKDEIAIANITTKR